MDTATMLLGIVGIVGLTVLGWAGRKRFPLRIGAGNFFRRKTQVAIVVAGLLIGTAIISSSFIIQSTFDYTVRAAVFRALDAVDEVVFVASPTGTRMAFSAQVWDDLRAHVQDMPDVAAVAPRYQLNGAVIDASTSLFEPTATVIGYDAAHDLGAFVRADGSSWDGSGLLATEAIINDKLAAAVEARVGDGLVVNVGGPQGLVRFNVTVNRIVRDAGRGAWDDGENLFLPLDALQAALGEAGKINTLTVAGVILWGSCQVFGASAFGGTGFILTWTDSDLSNGFAIGFLITMSTIGAASWRVSKMNIVRAIRDIPEPVQRRSTGRQVAVGAAVAVLGAVGLGVALVRQSLLLQDVGPVGLAFGLAVLTMRVLPPRAVFTAAGAF